MTRTELLTVQWLDGELDAEATAELELLVDSSPENAHMHDALVQLEITLRGDRRLSDVTSHVQSAIEERRQQRIVDGVLLAINERPPQPRRRPKARLQWAAACVLLLAVSAFAAVMASRSARPRKVLRPLHTVDQTLEPTAPMGEQPGRIPSSPAALAPFPRPLWRQDFETMPPLAHGILVQTPNAQGAITSAAEGSVSQYAGSTLITLRVAGFVWNEQTRILFDCKVLGGQSMTLLVWVPSSNQNFKVVLKGLPSDQWTHHEVHLADLKPVRFDTRPAAGADLHSLSFSTRLGVGLQIDNIEIDPALP